MSSYCPHSYTNQFLSFTSNENWFFAYFAPFSTCDVDKYRNNNVPLPSTTQHKSNDILMSQFLLRYTNHKQLDEEQSLLGKLIKSLQLVATDPLITLTNYICKDSRRIITNIQHYDIVFRAKRWATRNYS